ncbi:MAG: flavin-containing monooxygenase [Gemmatimonadales bacterium]
MTTSASSVTHRRVVIVGAGFAGIGAAAALRRAGIEDFIVLERAAELGGVWRDNVYPGCACDVQSHLYQYASVPNPDWTERYASGREIWDYLERCATELGVRPRIRFRREVTGLDWDEEAGHWSLGLGGERLTADLVILAVGALSEPLMPSIAGLGSFAGPVFHSARWEPSFQPRGRRIAVIGSGASAAQVIPAIQPVAEQVVSFQRTPAWVVPRWNRPVSTRRRGLFRRRPRLARLYRSWIHVNRELLGVAFRRPALMPLLEGVARLHLRRSVPDPALRAALTPRYLIGCKRILVSDDYLASLCRTNVSVATGGATLVREHAVVDAAGRAYEVDAIVCCTGFQASDFRYGRYVRGRGGRSLTDVWAGAPQAHLGTTVHGFPNLFILQGPHTGLGHSSVILIQEAQIEHVVGAVRYLEREGLTALEPTAEAQARFVAEVDRRMQRTVWLRGGCRSWYLDESGRNPTLWPGSVGRFRRLVAPFRAAEYRAWRVERPGPSAPADRGGGPMDKRARTP